MMPWIEQCYDNVSAVLEAMALCDYCPTVVSFAISLMALLTCWSTPVLRFLRTALWFQMPMLTSTFRCGDVVLRALIFLL